MADHTNKQDDLLQLRGRYNGERIFVIGNGPSLSETPLDKLESEHTIAINGINHIYDSVNWRPDFYVFLKNSMSKPEQEFVEQNIELGCECFINKKYSSRFDNNELVHYIKRKKLRTDPLTLITNGKMDLNNTDVSKIKDIWSTDIREGVYKKHSMYPTLQIVSYLGFEEIYFLGCDLGLEVQKPYLLFKSGLDPVEYINKQYFISASFRERKLVRSVINGVAYKFSTTRLFNFMFRHLTDVYGDSSHFTESYEKKIRFRDINKEIINEHRVAKKILNDNNVYLFNATLGGELEVYPRKNINEIIQN